MKYHNALTKSGSLTSLVQCYYLICIPSSVFAGCPSNVSSPPCYCCSSPSSFLSSSSPPRLILPLLLLLLRAIVFSGLGSSPGSRVALGRHVCSVRYGLEQLLSLSLSFMTLLGFFFKYMGRSLCRLSLSWNLSDVSSWLYSGNAFLPKIPQKWCVPPPYITAGSTWHWFVLFWDMLTLITWLEWWQLCFSTVTLLFSPLELLSNL